MTSPTMFRFLMLILMLAAAPLAGCPSSDDDDSASNDDDATGDDDDATGDDDDATGDDDDATGDDDDSGGGDDDDSAGGDDDDATGDDDDATGDDDDSSGDDDDSSGPCGMGDMTTALEVRVGGSPGASFSPTDNLTFAAIVHNPCPFEVTITSISTCLVSSWTATDSNGLATGAGVACGDAFTDFTVPSFDSIEETTSMGTFTAETYVGTADIDVPGLPDPTTGFTVQ